MRKKINIIIFLSIFLNFMVFAQENVFTVYKIDNDIITNIDIENESRYLIVLNDQLENLDSKKILELAETSLIKEIIKKNDLLKYYKLNQEDPYVDKLMKDFYTELKLKDESEFKEFLKNYNLTISKIKQKIEIETLWNQMIFERYNKQVNINIEDLKKRIDQNKNKSKEFFMLSEIYFEDNIDQPLDEKIKIIHGSILEIGFKNTANIYSLSDSANSGGDIGWINKENLSPIIKNAISKTKIGDYSETIQVGNGYIIFKVENIKNEIVEIDKKQLLNELIKFETNRQLEQFSKVYYNKLKINVNISEL